MYLVALRRLNSSCAFRKPKVLKVPVNLSPIIRTQNKLRCIPAYSGSRDCPVRWPGCFHSGVVKPEIPGSNPHWRVRATDTSALPHSVARGHTCLNVDLRPLVRSSSTHTEKIRERSPWRSLKASLENRLLVGVLSCAGHFNGDLDRYKAEVSKSTRTQL